ncbi:putative nuclease HARBI1 [Anopheles moucheti]|uniref:putative nuclease HARBI1 n=1 Tax=Anopheles moucheti TaxID=186751 RepID=UPI0022F0C471|nr:putative nuclease HARBI1 [Anopheles moucheti]XP_052901521.1 putative nuclease HARBI1 [Anopheles moucheti]
MIASILLSEAENSQPAVELKNYRRNLRKKLDPMSLDDSAFRNNFRISKQLFIDILRKITPIISPKHNRGLTVKQKLAASLKFLAQGSYQRGVGNDFTVPIGQSTFSEIFEETLCALENTLKHVITLEMTEEEQADARRFFYEKSGIPGAVLAIDGTHIRITAPHENPVMYYNRKGFYSMNALLICDHRNIIRYVNARFSGSNHDAFIFDSSPAIEYFENKWRNGERVFRLLGDSAYPTKPWLVKPFANALPGSQEAEFNTKHAQARVVIEKTIGMLKAKFRCLNGERQLRYSPTKVVRMVNVCCALHNICILNRIPEV